MASRWFFLIVYCLHSSFSRQIIWVIVVLIFQTRKKAKSQHADGIMYVNELKSEKMAFLQSHALVFAPSIHVVLLILAAQ